MRMSRANALHDFIISNIIFVGSKGVGRSTATDNGSRETKIVGRIERERERLSSPFLPPLLCSFLSIWLRFVF